MTGRDSSYHHFHNNCTVNNILPQQRRLQSEAYQQKWPALWLYLMMMNSGSNRHSGSWGGFRVAVVTADGAEAVASVVLAVAALEEEAPAGAGRNLEPCRNGALFISSCSVFSPFIDYLLYVVRKIGIEEESFFRYGMVKSQ